MDDKDTKPFWSSWTLWGIVATLVGVLLPQFGVNVDPSDVQGFFHSFQQALDAILTFGGMALAAYGRITADKELSLRRKS